MNENKTERLFSTTAIPVDNPHHNVVNLKIQDSVHQHFESLTTLSQKATALDAELQRAYTSRAPYPDGDYRTWLITSFWIITNFLAHDISHIISSFITDSNAMKDTAIFAKLELDFITINSILHQYLDLTKTKITFFRLLDLKSEPFHMAQQHRMFEYILDTTDALNSSTVLFMTQFHCALGTENSTSTFTKHIHKVRYLQLMYSHLMKMFKPILLSDSMFKVKSFIHSDKGRRVVHWISSAMKLFMPSFIPNTCEQLFEKLVDMSPSKPDLQLCGGTPKDPLRAFGTIARHSNTPASNVEAGSGVI